MGVLKHRWCTDCGADLGFVHYNTMRCQDCTVRVRNEAQVRYARKRWRDDPEFRARHLAYISARGKQSRRDPELVIADSRRQFESLCEKDENEAKRLLAELEDEEGSRFRKLLLDGIPERKGLG